MNTNRPKHRTTASRRTLTDLASLCTILGFALTLVLTIGQLAGLW
jgi:hypothetical protein